MSLRDRLAACSGMDVLDFYQREREHFIREQRTFGQIGMLEIQQPEGAYPDPASDNYVMLVPLRTDCRVRFDFGAGAIAQRFVGELSLATPGTICDYELSDTHHVIGFSIPARVVADLLRVLDPAFPGDFGALHATLWRDARIRDLALRIWRAAGGDARAPALDPDAALMQLALLLMIRAERGVPPEAQRYRLSPHIRRRVTDHVEANLDGDLSLFRLADLAGLSPYHFARAFRNDLGDPPHRYVMRRRIARARDLIRSGDLPLAEVAEACGFSSQSRLTQVFSQEIGTSPGALRAAHRGARVSLPKVSATRRSRSRGEA
jgi:AraC family transcriptional regulator